jgi:hypothetical protein
VRVRAARPDDRHLTAERFELLAGDSTGGDDESGHAHPHQPVQAGDLLAAAVVIADGQGDQGEVGVVRGFLQLGEEQAVRGVGGVAQQ